MNKKLKSGSAKSPMFRKGLPVSKFGGAGCHQKLKETACKDLTNNEVTKEESPEVSVKNSEDEAFKNQVERFIEISKYFSSPLRKSASYLSDQHLITYPSIFRIEYKRGNITTKHIKFCNLTLEPVYVKLFKLIPELEQIKYINLSLSRCKRIPPGLSFNLGFVYDDVNEKPSCNAKMIFVASRKTSTPCYQVCEIQLEIDAIKVRRVAQERNWYM